GPLSVDLRRARLQTHLRGDDDQKPDAPRPAEPPVRRTQGARRAGADEEAQTEAAKANSEAAFDAAGAAKPPGTAETRWTALLARLSSLQTALRGPGAAAICV